MTETEKVVAKFVSGFGGDRYKKVFDLLESKNLKPLGKSNTATLLFQQRISANEVNDIFAFRLGPPSVISFPKSYWLKRSTDLSTYLSGFSYSEKPPVQGRVSDSQYSAGQIEINRTTHERVMDVCLRVCATLK
tara:strand:+ start:3466 stop:3867 length:402 start_codon:yes stop_codon:yes gene_type:complete